MPQADKPEMEETVNAAVVEWARGIHIDQIPGVLVFLAARLMAAECARRDAENNGAAAPKLEKLLTAGALAELLGVPQSWVRSEERAGRIPSLRLGRYVRFKWPDVERVLAQRARQGAQNR